MTVYFADTTELDNPELYNCLYNAVSKERRIKTDSMKFQKDKLLSLGAEYLLMQACSEYGIDYKKQKVKLTENKRPVFENCEFDFNIAHSENRVMCVISKNRAGCDVEFVKPIDMEIAKRFFNNREYEEVMACETEEQRIDMFYRMWTLRESFVKCTGTGLIMKTDEYRVTLKESEPKVLQTYDSKKYRLFEFNNNDGYKYACCMQSSFYREDQNEKTQFKRIRFDLAALS